MDNTTTLDHALMFGVPLSLAILIAVGLYGVVHRDRAIHFARNLVHKPYPWGHSTTNPDPQAADSGDRVSAVTDESTRPDGLHEA